MERFSYKGGCGICGHVSIKMFKRKAGLCYNYYINKYSYCKINTITTSLNISQYEVLWCCKMQCIGIGVVGEIISFELRGA